MTPCEKQTVRTSSRCIALVLLVVLCLPLLAAYPRTANAQLGCVAAKAIETVKTKVFDAKDTAERQVAKGAPGILTKDEGALIIATQVAKKTSKTANEESFQNTIRCVLDGLAWTAAHVALQSLTQSTVNWINSGFEGSPAFVTDLNRNLGNLADSVANDFFTELNTIVQNSTGFNIRSPFQDQIAEHLRAEFYRTTSSYGFDIRNPYTLQNCSSNPTAFTRGDFSQGGFDAWYCLSQNQANNPYGRYLLARDELTQRLSDAATQRVKEIEYGSGFLSWRGPCGPYRNPNTTTTTDLSQAEKNARCPIRTPGALIENVLGISATSPFRQLELADSVNEIVAALMTQMVNQVLGGGGLSGLSSPSSGGGPSYLSQATNPSVYNQQAASIVDGFTQVSLPDLRAQIVAYQAGWQRIASAASTAKQACSTDSAKAQEANTVLQNANQSIAAATALLARLDQVQAQTNSGDSPGKTVTGYQDILAEAGKLAAGEDEGEDTGDAVPGSLYSQMVRLAASCR